MTAPEVRREAHRTAASRAVAARVAAVVDGPGSRRPVVLGLPTGASPAEVYGELARLHREQGLSFARVTGVALDEYVPMGAEDPRSFAAALRRAFAEPLDLPSGGLIVPDGRRDGEAGALAAAAHERLLEERGPVDIQLLGIGRNGHLAFNEPGSPLDSVTRLVDLGETTRRDAAAAFGGLDAVPRRAITMGLGSILRAREIHLLAFGQAKAAAVAAALTGPVTPQVPASVLQRHPAVTVWLDPAAASVLDG